MATKSCVPYYEEPPGQQCGERRWAWAPPAQPRPVLTPPGVAGHQVISAPAWLLRKRIMALKDGEEIKRVFVSSVAPRESGIFDSAAGRREGAGASVHGDRMSHASGLSDDSPRAWPLCRAFLLTRRPHRGVQRPRNRSAPTL